MDNSLLDFIFSSSDTIYYITYNKSTDRHLYNTSNVPSDTI